jgi:hypothetical protein
MSFNNLIFVMEKCRIFPEVGTEISDVIQTSFGFKRLREIFSYEKNVILYVER